MLNRCRVLLGLVYYGQMKRECGISQNQLTRGAFALSENGNVLPRSTAYDFVPYKDSPYSFSLSRDLNKLIQQAYLGRGPDDSILVPDEATALVRQEIERLSSEIREATFEITREYVDRSDQDIQEELIARFPWYVSRMQAGERERTHLGSINTCGYEGKTVESFFDTLLREGIDTVLDVRRNPISRVYGFAKSAMAYIAHELKLEYVHLPEMGIDSAKRKHLDTPEDYSKLLDWYESTLPEREEGICRVAQYVLSSPSVLVCVEADPTQCHRGRLAKALNARTHLPIRHLT